MRQVSRSRAIAPPKKPTSKSSALRRQPQQQRSQARIESLLEAAAKTFWEKGYRNATTHDIAQAANTAVGTLYRFFPNKLAILHELERRHRDQVEAINSQLLTASALELPLAVIIRQIVETFGDYFKALGPRVVYIQYFLTPELFLYFDDSFDQQNISTFAQLLRGRNPALTLEKSELIALAFLRTYQALLLSALRGPESQLQPMYAEMQTMLTNYLAPYVGDHLLTQQSTVEAHIQTILKSHHLNARQQAALRHSLLYKELSIQTMEAFFPERSRRTLQRDLKALVEKDLLCLEGSTNQSLYRPAHTLSLTTSSDKVATGAD